MARPLALLLIPASLAAFASPALAEVVIGVAGPMSGIFRPVGEQIRAGVDAAVGALNAAGGIGGETVRVEVVDDRCEAKTAEAVANQLVGKGVSAVVGHACTAAAIPAARVYSGEGIPLISPAVTNPRFTDEKIGPAVFRLAPRGDAQAAAIGRYLTDRYAGRRVGFASDGSVYGKQIVDGARAAFEATGTRAIFNETYTPGERSQVNLTGKVQDAALDALVIGGSDADAAVIAQDVKGRGLSTQLVGGDTLGLQGFNDAAGPAAEGVIFALPDDLRSDPAAGPALEQVRAAGQEPTSIALSAYAAVEILARALSTGGDAGQAIRTAPTDTVIGPVSFDAKGDSDRPGFSLFTWRGDGIAPAP